MDWDYDKTIVGLNHICNKVAEHVLEVIGNRDFTSQKISDIEKINNATCEGLNNVYDKFLELEKRQNHVEKVLLKTETMYSLLKSIPTEEEFENLLSKLKNHKVIQVNKKVDEIKAELENLMNKLY